MPEKAATAEKPKPAIAPKDAKPVKPKPDEESERLRLAEREKKEPMRSLARRAVEIAEAGGASLGSSITAPQAEQVARLLGEQDPIERFSPASITQLQAYAQGGKLLHRSDLPPESRDAIRTLCRETGSRRIWPRKVAALALAIHEQRTGKVRPGTTVPPKSTDSSA